MDCPGEFAIRCPPVRGVLAVVDGRHCGAAALLVGLAFSAIGMALVTFLRSTAQFDYIALGLMPMFLFATTFFPLSVYPEPLQWVVRCLPLYHAVELMRGLATGLLSGSMLVNLAYLLALGALGLWASTRRIAKLLLT